MPISFPTSPSNGDTHVIGSITYQYDSTDDKWTGLGITPSDRLVEGSNSLEINASNDLVWTGDNVGINDTSPDNKLHITTTSSSAYSTNTTNTSNLTNALLKLQNLDGSDGTGVNNYVGVQFSVANGATSTAQMQYVRTGDNAGKFEFKARNTSSNYPNIMTLLSSGNVGINRTDPDQRLNVNGNIEVNAYDSAGGSGGYFTSSGLIIGNLYDAGKSYTGSDDRTACVWQERGLDLDFATNDTFRMKLTYDGLVQIGTSTTSSFPDRLLSVGDITRDSSYIDIRSDVVGGLLFADGTSGDAAYRGQVDYNHNDDELRLWTAATVRMRVSSVGRIRFPNVPGVAGSNLANLQIESDGNLCTTTSIRAAKTNISPLADTSWLFDLNPVTFNWRTKTENEDGTLTWGEEADGGIQYGLIAEEVEAVKDDFCYYDNDGELSGVHYDRLVAPLLKVVQQQKEEIEALKARLEAGGL